MKMIWGVFFFLLVSFSFAATEVDFVQIPGGCFDNDVHCSNSSVKKKMIDGVYETVIRINIFALLSKDDYESADEIIDILLDFPGWKDSVDYARPKAVKVKKSLTLSPLEENGRTIYRQYLSYKVYAPAPFFYYPARAIAHFWLIDPFPGATISGEFVHLNSGTHQIPGEPILIGSEGYRYHKGHYHISEDDENFYLHFSSEIIPNIELLPKVVARYIKNGYVAILNSLYLE